MTILEVPAAHKNLVNSDILSVNVSGVGLGHLGSWTLMGLAQLGVPELYLYDFDDVEDRNLSGTPYRSENVTKCKVEVLKTLIEEGNHETKFIQAINQKITKSEDFIELTNFYIISTDDLESRLEIFRAINANHLKNSKGGFLIDLRSRAKISEVYVVNLENEASSYWYEKSIETRLMDKTVPVHCNESNIIQNSYLASSIAIQAFSDILDGDVKTKYFRLSIGDYNISNVKVPLRESEKEFRKMKLSEACQNCGIKHKTWKKLQSCNSKPVKPSKTSKNDGLPEREAIFD